jgi:hypothetical protein
VPCSPYRENFFRKPSKKCFEGVLFGKLLGCAVRANDPVPSSTAPARAGHAILALQLSVAHAPRAKQPPTIFCF